MAWPNTLDMSEDHEVWVNTEIVTYYSKTEEAPPDDTERVDIEGTLWQSIRKDRLPADSILLNMDVLVTIPRLKALGIVPKANDLLTRCKDDSRWVVRIVEVIVEDDEYRCALKRNPRSA